MHLPRSPKLLAALRAAGVDLDGPPSPLLAPGTLIIAFEVPMRPVPWKAPTVLKTGHSYKDKRLVAWQEEVARCARAAMGGRSPYPGPVRLSMKFYLSPRGGSRPDTTNLLKAAEDALQGSVILNDRKVTIVEAVRYSLDTDSADICVYASEDQ